MKLVSVLPGVLQIIALTKHSEPDASENACYFLEIRAWEASLGSLEYYLVHMYSNSRK